MVVVQEAVVLILQISPEVHFLLEDLVEAVAELPHTEEEMETHQHQHLRHKELMEVVDIIVIHM
jgi:hypothetical protein